jgi:nicotinamidase-related amidase
VSHLLVDGPSTLPDWVFPRPALDVEFGRCALVIEKNSSSPCNSTGVDQLLRNLGVDSLFLTGMATDMCVDNTADVLAWLAARGEGRQP